MASQSPLTWTLTIPDDVADAIWAHHFDDDDEHGGVLLAGLARDDRGLRLIGREFIAARDGSDYVEGVYGYRRLAPAFVRAGILRARDENLVYLAIHNHRGRRRVAFSDDDLASQRRGYPALIDITRGGPVGALVVASEAVAGNLWLAADEVAALRETRLIGEGIRRLYPAPPMLDAPAEIFDRQTRVFGPAGQSLLGSARVGVLGAGGAGMLLVEYLARLGVGHLVVVDPDRVELTNIPRLPGATRADVGRPKIEIAARLAQEANPDITFTGLRTDVTDPDAAAALARTDYLFCAADTMRARLMFNSLVQQFGIPGIQVGAKVRSDADTGALLDVRSVVRAVAPGRGCLWCNGLISSAALAEESLSPAERAAQRYVDDADISAPAVITLNAVAASHAANAFLLRFAEATVDAASGYLTIDHRRGRFVVEEPRRDADCPECGTGAASRRARGDGVPLPVRIASVA